MPDWIAIIILGIVEGITEFLPISSTAHLLIVENWLPRQTDLFNIVIQSGAVIAVLPLFPERLHQFVFQWRDKATQDYALKILLAVIITGIGGFFLDKAGFKLPERLWPVAWAMLIGGIGFLVIERWLSSSVRMAASSPCDNGWMKTTWPPQSASSGRIWSGLAKAES